MKFEFTQDEANIILKSLAVQPFEQVYMLVGKLQQQATAQLQPKPKKVKKEQERHPDHLEGYKETVTRVPPKEDDIDAVHNSAA